MIRSAIKRFGFFGCIENAIIHCLNKIGICIHVMEVFVYEMSGIETNNRDNLNIRVLELNDFERQTKLNPLWFNPRKIEDMRSAFALDGNIPLGIVANEMIVAYGWVSLNTMGLENIVLKESDGYLWDDYTHPDHRGKGLHSAINQARVAFLFSMGKARALTQVAHYNRASRVGYIRNGFKRETKYFKICVGGINYSSLKYNNRNE